MTRTRTSWRGRLTGTTGLATVAGLLAAFSPLSQACRPFTPVITCVRTSTLTLVSPGTIVNTAPLVVVVPFLVSAQDDQRSACPAAEPTTTTVTLTAEGVVGSTTVVHGGSTSVTGTVSLTLPPGPDRMVAIAGTAATAWSVGGSPGGSTTASSATSACVVADTPANPGVPRLDVLLPGAVSDAIGRAHPGDESIHLYRLINNDPINSVGITVEARTTQIARLPALTGAGPGVGPLSLAAPTEGDHFPVAFRDDIATGPTASDWTHQLDDDSAEIARGPDGAGGDYLWMNTCPVVAGQETVTGVDVVFGPGSAGTPMQVLLFAEGPIDDGDPSDAVLVAMSDRVVANIGAPINSFSITPTSVAGRDHFFIGILMRDIPSCTSGFCPAVIDSDTVSTASWEVISDTPCGLDPTDLPSNDVFRALSDEQAGVFFVRPRGNGEVPCLVLGDPSDTATPTTTRTIRLCPGETRDLEIVTRAWGACTSGSCSQVSVVASGIFADGGSATACAGSAHLVDAGAAPDFAWPDSIQRLCLEPPGAFSPELRYFEALPGGDVGYGLQMLDTQLQMEAAFVQLPPELRQAQPLLGDLQGKLRWGRLTQSGFAPDGPFPPQPFFSSVTLELQPLVPAPPDALVIVDAHVIASDSGVPSTSVGVMVRAEGPADGEFSQWLLSIAVAAGGGTDAPLPGIIDHASVLPTWDGSTLFLSFFGQFDTPVLEVEMVVDALAGAGGLVDGPPPCPGDVDDDGLIGFTDLVATLAAWGPYGPCPPFAVNDIDQNCEIGFTDLVAILAAWGPCPD